MPQNSSSLSTQGQRHDRIEHHGVAFGEPDDDEGDLSISLGQKMLSAISGSLITSLLVTPLDVVRVRLQSQAPPPPPTSILPHSYSFTNLPPNLGITSCCREVFWVSNNTAYCVATPAISITDKLPNKSIAACAAEETQKTKFTSTIDGLRKIARNEGTRSLWRGLSPTLLMAVPGNVIYFAGYDWLRFSPKSPFKRARINDTYIPLVAGSSARVIAAIAIGPVEMFRTRMQAAHNTGGNGSIVETLHGMRELIKIKGYHSLWTGLGLTLWRDVPFSAIYWWGYEWGRDILHDMRVQARNQTLKKEGLSSSERARRPSVSRDNHTTTLIDSFISGAASGAVAALVTTPFDVGKTRQQTVKHATAMSATAKSTAQKLPEELSMPRFLLHIFKTQGVSGLFTGWGARCLKVAPACAIMISSYEIGKKMAGGINDKRASQRDL